MSSIAIIAPSPIRGSGGVARIYRFANALSEHGHQTDVYVFDCGVRTALDLGKDARDFYSVNGVHITAGIDLVKKYDLIIASRWDTAIMVRDMPAKVRAYFIQDFEACFNPVGDGTILAENSYLYGLQSITYGRWLALKLYMDFGNSPYICNFAADLSIFRVTQQMKSRIHEPPAVCFIYQHDKPRRCPRLGIEALGIVKSIRPDVKLYFVGSNESPKLWYSYTNVGLLGTQGLNELYNRCHVGLCLSSSNPSCNAFDMMSAGLPSVDLYRENNLYDIPSGGVLLAHQTPESIAEAILYLISSPDKLLEMSEFGVEYMKSRSDLNEKDEFISAIDNIISEKPNEFDVNEVFNRCYIGAAVIAAAYRNTAVMRHVHSQRIEPADNVYEIQAACNAASPTGAHNYVTGINFANDYIEIASFRSRFSARIKRLLKRALGID